MVGMNFNGIVKGNELRLVAQEIFKKAKVKPELGQGEAATVTKKNPFAGALSKTEFTPEETKSAKASYEQGHIQMGSDIRESVKSLAAINKYSNLAFRSQGEIAGDAANELPMPDFMAGVSDVNPEQGKKNPLLAFLLALIVKSSESNGKEDPVKIMFAAATAAKKQK